MPTISKHRATASVPFVKIERNPDPSAAELSALKPVIQPCCRSQVPPRPGAEHQQGPERLAVMSQTALVSAEQLPGNPAIDQAIQMAIAAKNLLFESRAQRPAQPGV